MVRRGPRARVLTASVLVIALSTVLAGCGADVERQQAGVAADTFSADVTTDPEAACALLAPRAEQAVAEDGTSCATALPEEDLPAQGKRTSVAVAGHSAQVRYAKGTVFLSLFDDGWRVVAAGCSRTSTDPAVPYDCVVDGS
jgi:hypothetical protein